MMPGFINISYYGMLEFLGQYQMLAYSKRLAAGCLIHLTTSRTQKLSTSGRLIHRYYREHEHERLAVCDGAAWWLT